ncbi:toxin [Winkia neuii]|uniref:Toxin n=1 Tax=Winkia neuii TaxID=33007 RepID=A0A2I1IQA7_9ACTO|nr:toxin [Winkia neuii]
MSDEDILHAASWPQWVEPLDEENPQRELRLGFATDGRLLETVVLIFDSGNELVIHAMKAGPHYARLLG